MFFCSIKYETKMTFQPDTTPHSSILSSVEKLFMRAPTDGGQFCPFTPSEYKECVSLLKDYPHFSQITSNFSEQSELYPLVEFPPHFRPLGCSAEEFANFHARFFYAANSLADSVLTHALKMIDTEYGMSEPSKVIIPAWRAGLAFIHSNLKADAGHIWHVGAKRDPETLQCSLYHVGSLDTELDLNNTHFVLSDPFIGTGYTVIRLLEELQEYLGSQLSPQQIHLACFAITPEGATRLISRFPGVSITAAHSDSYINEKGWVVSNNSDEFFGDGGDFYAVKGLSPQKIKDLEERGLIDSTSKEALERRLAES